jgi:hypothetical protein
MRDGGDLRSAYRCRRADASGRNTHARKAKLTMKGLVTVSPSFGLMI